MGMAGVSLFDVNDYACCKPPEIAAKERKNVYTGTQ
jgi:hypothetical protein